MIAGRIEAILGTNYNFERNIFTHNYVMSMLWRQPEPLVVHIKKEKKKKKKSPIKFEHWEFNLTLERSYEYSIFLKHFPCNCYASAASLPVYLRQRKHKGCIFGVWKGDVTQISTTSALPRVVTASGLVDSLDHWSTLDHR